MPRPLLSAAIVVLALAHLHAADTSWDLPDPSPNRGQTGTYKASTSHKGYNYYVCVAGKFSAERPAGIHVFFHGLGGQSMARNFQLWRPFLTDGRCIGINMEYTDGNPHKDMEGKAAAAREAVRQVMADYPVAVGRGAMTAFSAGGSPAGKWFGDHGHAATAFSPDWPINHVNVFGSALNCGKETSRLPVSWLRAMGEGEERMAPGLLRYMSAKTAANLTVESKAACRDAVFLVTKGRGHTIRADEVKMAAACFHRSATVLAPFLYRPVEVDRELGAIIDAANAHHFAKALEALEKLGGARATHLRKLIEAQMQSQLELCGQLAKTDPTLAQYYADRCREQFRDTPAADRLERALGADEEASRRRRILRDRWNRQFCDLFTGKGIRLAPKAAPYLRQMIEHCGETSTIGVMAARYLAFAPADDGTQDGR